MKTSIDNKAFINIDKKIVGKILEKLPESFVHFSCEDKNKYTGKNVKIAILDSGTPKHKDIRLRGERASFCEESSVDDKIGHATMIAGVIGANNSNTITGVAPHSEMLFGKVFNSKKECSFNSLVTGVLWAVVKEVDILVLALGAEFDYVVFHDALKKAKSYGICIFAACGNITNKAADISYPSKYPEVFSAGFLTRTKAKNEIIKEKVDFCLPNKNLYTTYLKNSYVKASGSSISTAFFAGNAAILIEKYRNGVKKEDMPSKIYSELSRMFNQNGKKRKKGTS